MTTQGRLPEELVSACHSLYFSLKYNPPLNKFTIIAAFILSSPAAYEIVSIGCGSKCLPEARLPLHGDALHDCHAEVIARRGLVRWLLEEIGRDASGVPSGWLVQGTDGKYALRPLVRLCLYVSTPPCKSIYPIYDDHLNVFHPSMNCMLCS